MKNLRTSWISASQPACRQRNLLCFLFCYGTVSLSFPFQDMELRDVVHSNTGSTLQATTRHLLCHASQALERLTSACCLVEFSCCLPRWNITYAMSLTLVHILAKTETLCGRSQDVLLLNELHTNSIYLIQCQWFRGVRACLTFQFRWCTVTEGILKTMIKRPHTISTRIHTGHYWRHCDVTIYWTPILKTRCRVGELHSGL